MHDVHKKFNKRYFSRNHFASGLSVNLDIPAYIIDWLNVPCSG